VEIGIWKAVMWSQLGASIEMLENAIEACPESLWTADRPKNPFWYVAFHALFFLDLYLSETVQGFQPPPPFTLSELDPAGIRPERAYTKEELGAYLRWCREKCIDKLDGLTEEHLLERCGFRWFNVNIAELYLDILRHVQHHAAQLNLVLRQTLGDSPSWVAKAKS
jgi:hypothetical protein